LGHWIELLKKEQFSNDSNFETKITGRGITRNIAIGITANG